MPSVPHPDENDSRQFLEAHLGRTVESVAWIGDGAWSRCFGFVDRGLERVVRFGHQLDDFEKDQHAASFRSNALPVPEVIEVGYAFDAYFAISTRVHGEPLESLSAVGWVAVCPSLFAALDATRSIDVSSTSGYGDWNAVGDAPQQSWHEFLLAVDADVPTRRTYGWRQKLIASPIGDDLFRSGHARLAELSADLDVDRSVVHGDLINRNVFVIDARITGVLDWGCSFYGDFLYDIAWLQFWSPWFEALAAMDPCEQVKDHYASIGLAVPNFDERLRCCMIHIGLDHLAYNAHVGNIKDLVAVAEQLVPLID